MLQHVERVVDLLDPALNAIENMSLEEARRRVLSGDPASVAGIEGSFAIVARDGITVRLARTLDRPMRYFLAKRQEGPALFVADRIDTLQRALADEGLDGQFHPSYTRMAPAHYVVELRLVGCPDPDPAYTRFFTPVRDALPPDLDEIGRRYVGAVAREVSQWLSRIERTAPDEPLGVAFSGGIDSGAVFLVTYHAMLALGLSPARLKAFTLNLGGGRDLDQARAFLEGLGLSMFLEEIAADPADLDLDETLRTLEDYKPLDVECAAMGLLLARGIRERYPGVAVRHRRRRRGREPEGLPDRGEQRADDPQRGQQSDAVPRGVGRREDQALADLQRRPEPRIRADVRSRPAVWLRRVQPVHAAKRHRGGGGHPIHHVDGLRCRDPVCAEGGDRPPRRPCGHRFRNARVPETTISGRRRRPGVGTRQARRQRAHLSRAVPRAVRLMTGVPGAHATGAERDRFVLAQRPARRALDPWRHQGVLIEPERAADGRVVQVATIFLTGRECPWRCVMCDLWQHTIQEHTPAGALVHQLDQALESVRRDGVGVDHVKLYNAGSFFDPRAVPEQDYEPLAALLAGATHVIVESHPALIGPRLTRFRAALAARGA